MKRAEIPGFKVAGTWHFKKDDIDAWIDARKTAATADEALLDGLRRSR